MTDLEKSLLKSLLALEAAARPSDDPNRKQTLMTTISEVEKMTHSFPKSTDPTLLHYLHKKSYQKAILYLKGRDAENQLGNCGHLEP
jgi:hypothetical protein